MAARPNDGNSNAAGGDLLGLDDSQPAYSTGQRPPVDDNDLLKRYDIDDSDQAQPRPSTSYDDFVGGRPPGQPDAHSHPQSRSGFQPTPPNAPYSDNQRAYSQTSDLH